MPVELKGKKQNWNFYGWAFEWRMSGAELTGRAQERAEGGVGGKVCSDVER